MELDKKTRIMLFPRVNKIIIIIFAIAFLLTGLRAYQLFQYVFDVNVKTETSIIISRDAGYNQVLDSLQKYDVLIDYKAFRWVSKRKKYAENIKTGHYLFAKGMTTNQIVNMLKAGNQKPVNVTFNNVRTLGQLAGAVSKYIEADSLDIAKCFSDSLVWSEFGYTKQTFPEMFIPNSYECYWTITPKQFVERMSKEYKRFWNDTRKKKAAAKGLTPNQVSVLASIVQEETVKDDEKPIVAGLYINRLRRGMLLQADPTIKFAINDFTVRRVLNEYLEVDSPYNTYKYAGLPPGPINIPEISSLNAVLNAKNHRYLYMCAREDFSGYHNFSATLGGHNRNAAKYRAALNKNKIWE